MGRMKVDNINEYSKTRVQTKPENSPFYTDRTDMWICSEDTIVMYFSLFHSFANQSPHSPPVLKKATHTYSTYLDKIAFLKFHLFEALEGFQFTIYRQFLLYTSFYIHSFAIPPHIKKPPPANCKGKGGREGAQVPSVR